MRRAFLLSVLICAACVPAPGAESEAGAAAGPEPAGANVRVVPVRDGGMLLSAEAMNVACLAIAEESWPEERGIYRDAFLQACPALTFTTTRRTDSILYIDRETNADLTLALRFTASDGEYGWDGRLVRVWTDASRFTWTASIDRRRPEAQTRAIHDELRAIAAEDTISMVWGQSMRASSWDVLPAEIREDVELDVRARVEAGTSAGWAPGQTAWTVVQGTTVIGYVASIEDRSTTLGPLGKRLWYDAWGRYVLETDLERPIGR